MVRGRFLNVSYYMVQSAQWSVGELKIALVNASSIWLVTPETQQSQEQKTGPNLMCVNTAINLREQARDATTERLKSVLRSVMPQPLFVKALD